MRFRLPLALALAVAVLTPAPMAAQAWEDELAIQIRETVREVLRDTRHVVRIETRHAGRAVRDAMREVRHAMRDVAREVRREARHAGRSSWNGGPGWSGAEAGQRTTSPTDDPCAERGDWGRGERHCEVREERLAPFGGPLVVDARPNGGIRVEAWDQSEILVRAVVNTQAETAADAARIASEVRVEIAGGRIAATGPDTRGRRREGWHVSYRVYVPARTDLDLQSTNGGVSIAGVTGTLRFETTNGGVTLNDVAGDVRGRTRNGGVNVALGGARWEGAGLDVQTTNGGVTLSLPDGYSAELSARTVNGGLRSDVPLTVRGRISREITSTLGSGGAPVTVRTTNGGLRITRR